MGEIVTLSAEDGHTLAAYRATPQGKARGGLVIVQEIFGVNSHIRRVTDGFAADGYVALAPAIFDRAEPGFMTGYRQEDIDRGRAVRMKIPPAHWKTVSTAHPDVSMHVYPAGHGFNCDERGSYHEPSAKLARTRTLEFLERHLG